MWIVNFATETFVYYVKFYFNFIDRGVPYHVEVNALTLQVYNDTITIQDGMLM